MEYGPKLTIALVLAPWIMGAFLLLTLALTIHALFFGG
jgi:hypothetical protein